MTFQKKTLVTGGAGFLGSHLCARLISMGYHVTCLDNLFTGNIRNIKELLDNPNFRFVEQDITLPHYGVYDEIYNLACPASPVQYQLNPIKTFQTCVFGAFNMLELAKGCNAKILQASTSEVYGDPFVHPQKESYWGNVNPIGVRSCYDEGKRAAETVFMDFHLMHHTPIKIVRIFNTYGPRMSVNDGRVVSNFIIQALKNTNLTIYGDGKQTRSFQYVDNLIDGFIKVMTETEDSFTGPINMGSVFEFTMLELAEMVIRLTGSKSKITFKPLPNDDPRQRKPDISLAKELINYQPDIRVEDGIQRTIDYFKSIL